MKFFLLVFSVLCLSLGHLNPVFPSADSLEAGCTPIFGVNKKKVRPKSEVLSALSEYLEPEEIAALKKKRGEMWNNAIIISDGPLEKSLFVALGTASKHPRKTNQILKKLAAKKLVSEDIPATELRDIFIQFFKKEVLKRESEADFNLVLDLDSLKDLSKGFINMFEGLIKNVGVAQTQSFLSRILLATHDLSKTNSVPPQFTDILWASFSVANSGIRSGRKLDECMKVLKWLRHEIVGGFSHEGTEFSDPRATLIRAVVDLGDQHPSIYNTGISSDVFSGGQHFTSSAMMAILKRHLRSPNFVQALLEHEYALKRSNSGYGVRTLSLLVDIREHFQGLLKNNTLNPSDTRPNKTRAYLEFEGFVSLVRGSYSSPEERLAALENYDENYNRSHNSAPVALMALKLLSDSLDGVSFNVNDLINYVDLNTEN